MFESRVKGKESSGGTLKSLRKAKEFIVAVEGNELLLQIEVLDGQSQSIGQLLPITKSSLEDAELILRLTCWRQNSMRHFFTWYTANCDKTREWLRRSVLTDPSRMIFVVHSEGRAIGTMGFKLNPNGSAEFGNLLRGERGGHHQLMYYAELALVGWIFRSLPVDLIYGDAIADNPMCSTLQRSLGFRKTARIPLVKVESEGEVRLKMGEPGSLSPEGLYAQRFELTGSEFLARRASQRGP